MQQFIDLLSSFNPNKPIFPPTEIYNEGWLLRLVLNWFSKRGPIDHPLSFHTESGWFSEALIPSPFLLRYRGDRLAEARTHADGVIGQIEIGRSGKADLDLLDDASQFVILEAKINSPLSSGTKNAPNYDQAARNVACIAEVLRRCEREPQMMSTLGFYVLAPEDKIRAGTFERVLAPNSIHTKVKRRVSSYEGERDDWYADWFLPLMEKLYIDPLSWEEIIQRIGEEDGQASNSLREFFEYCLLFN